MLPPNKCLMTVECISGLCGTKERKNTGILFYKGRRNIDCHWPQRHIIQDVNLSGPESPSHGPQNSQRPCIHQYMLKMSLPAKLTGKVKDPKCHTGSWVSNIQMSPRLCAIRLCLRLKHFHLQWRIPSCKTKTKQKSACQPICCQWCARSGLQQLVRAKRQLLRNFVSQLTSHCSLRSATLRVFILQASANTTNQDLSFSSELGVRHLPEHHQPHSCPTAPARVTLVFNEIFHFLNCPVTWSASSNFSMPSIFESTCLPSSVYHGRVKT